jgi:hypothetical protein
MDPQNFLIDDDDEHDDEVCRENFAIIGDDVTIHSIQVQSDVLRVNEKRARHHENEEMRHEMQPFKRQRLQTTAAIAEADKKGRA